MSKEGDAISDPCSGHHLHEHVVGQSRRSMAEVRPHHHHHHHHHHHAPPHTYTRERAYTYTHLHATATTTTTNTTHVKGHHLTMDRLRICLLTMALAYRWGLTATFPRAPLMSTPPRRRITVMMFLISKLTRGNPHAPTHNAHRRPPVYTGAVMDLFDDDGTDGFRDR